MATAPKSRAAATERQLDLKGNEELLIQLGHDYCDYLSSEGAISAQERIGNILDDQPLAREAVMVSAGNELCPELDPAR